MGEGHLRVAEQSYPAAVPQNHLAFYTEERFCQQKTPALKRFSRALEYTQKAGGCASLPGPIRLKKNGATSYNFKLSFQKIRTVRLARVRDQ